MIRRALLIIICVLCYGIASAQEPFKERIFGMTTQEEYAAGSEVWFSLTTLDADCRPMAMSRVAAVEIFSDTKMLRTRIALNDGRGRGVIRLPQSLPTGRYTFMAYTRNMQNEGEEYFFTKPLDIVAAGTAVRPSAVCTRETDSLAFERFKAAALPIAEVAHLYRPEVDGEVILGRFVRDVGYAGEVRMPNLSILGRDLHYYPGTHLGNDTVEFVVPVLAGQTTLFTGCKRGGHVELMEPFRPNGSTPGLSPKGRERPTPAPSLRGRGVDTASSENPLIGVATSPLPSRFLPLDNEGGTRGVGAGVGPSGLPHRTYDLDQWRRFDTFKEMFLEFMPTVSTVDTDEGARIALFNYQTERFNGGNTLVLLDGVAVTVHEDLLGYDPRQVKRVDLYYGTYSFGHEVYDGIFSCTTHQGTLPRYELPENTCVNTYEAVQR